MFNFGKKDKNPLKPEALTQKITKYFELKDDAAKKSASASISKRIEKIKDPKIIHDILGALEKQVSLKNAPKIFHELLLKKLARISPIETLQYLRNSSLSRTDNTLYNIAISQSISQWQKNTTHANNNTALFHKTIDDIAKKTETNTQNKALLISLLPADLALKYFIEKNASDDVSLGMILKNSGSLAIYEQIERWTTSSRAGDSILRSLIPALISSAKKENNIENLNKALLILLKNDMENTAIKNSISLVCEAIYATKGALDIDNIIILLKEKKDPFSIAIHNALDNLKEPPINAASFIETAKEAVSGTDSILSISSRPLALRASRPISLDSAVFIDEDESTTDDDSFDLDDPGLSFDSLLNKGDEGYIEMAPSDLDKIKLAASTYQYSKFPDDLKTINYLSSQIKTNVPEKDLEEVILHLMRIKDSGLTKSIINLCEIFAQKTEDWKAQGAELNRTSNEIYNIYEIFTEITENAEEADLSFVDIIYENARNLSKATDPIYRDSNRASIYKEIAGRLFNNKYSILDRQSLIELIKDSREAVKKTMDNLDFTIDDDTFDRNDRDSTPLFSLPLKRSDPVPAPVQSRAAPVPAKDPLKGAIARNRLGKLAKFPSHQPHPITHMRGEKNKTLKGAIALTRVAQAEKNEKPKPNGPDDLDHRPKTRL